MSKETVLFSHVVSPSVSRGNGKETAKILGRLNQRSLDTVHDQRTNKGGMREIVGSEVQVKDVCLNI